MLRKGLKYIAYFLLAMLFAIVTALLLTQTPWFRNLAKEQALKYANATLNARIELGSIKGNLFSTIELDSLSISQKEDSSHILLLNTLKANYNLWALLKKSIHINSIDLDELNVRLKQDSSGKWNLTEIFPVSKDTTAESRPFGFKVKMDSIGIQNADIHLQTVSAFIPDSITGLYLNASFGLSPGTVSAALHHLELLSFGPDIVLKELQARLIKNNDLIQLKQLLLQTQGTELNAQANYQTIGNSSVKAGLEPLSNREVKQVVPAVKLVQAPVIQFHYETRGTDSHVQVSLSIPGEEVSLQTTINGLEAYITDKTSLLPFKAGIRLKNVHPENWWQIDTTESVVNGLLEIDGSHLLDITKWKNINGNLDQSAFRGHRFDQLELQARQNNNTVDVSVVTRSAVGRARARISLSDIFTLPQYDMDLAVDSLLLSAFLDEDAGYANARLKARGKNIKPESIELRGRLDILSSHIYGLAIDSAFFITQMQNSTITLDSSSIGLPGALVDLSGQFNLSTGKLEGKAALKLDSLTFLKSYELPDIRFSKASGVLHVNGTPDSLLATGQFDMTRFKGFSLLGDSIHLRYDASMIHDSLLASSHLNIEELRSGDLLVDSIRAEINYAPEMVKADISAGMDSISARIRTIALLGDTTIVNLPLLNLTTPHISLYIAQENNKISLSQKNVSIENISIKDHESPDFVISINGRIGQNNSEDFNLKIDHLNLNALNRLHLTREDINGLFSLDLHLTGPGSAPQMQSSFSLSKVSYGVTEAPDLAGEVTLNNQVLKSLLYVPEIKDELSLSFSTPVEARFDTAGFVFATKDEFEAELRIDSLEITNPTDKHLRTSFNGELKADIRARGTYRDPLFYGTFRLKNGQLTYSDYGVQIDKANIALQFDSNKVAIDTFLVTRDKGFLTLNGEATFDSSIVSGKIQGSSLQMDAQEFMALKHHNYTAQINAKTFYKTNNDQGEFGGNIEILRSDIYLPALTPDKDEKPINEKPLLVEAIEPLDSSMTSSRTDSLIEVSKQSSRFIENLRGRLKLEIPRNTWIKSDEMKIEIWGDLEVEKSSPYFELYGTVGINRGQYILYGKKFIIEEGQVTFQGGEEFDPVLNLKATHTYRGSDKEKRNLALIVTDKLSEPTIRFTLDGATIPEADGVSILLFGKTTDEISFSGQNGVSGAMANQVIAKALTSQLSKTLGNKLNLDMIEITATENWQSAAFVVGKYVTNDLFVIYQKGFGESDGDEITPEMVILEYELNRYLFFRLQSGSSKDSGFDVILKLESKKD